VKAAFQSVSTRELFFRFTPFFSDTTFDTELKPILIGDEVKGHILTDGNDTKFGGRRPNGKKGSPGKWLQVEVPDLTGQNNQTRFLPIHRSDYSDSELLLKPIRIAMNPPFNTAGCLSAFSMATPWCVSNCDRVQEALDQAAAHIPA